MGDIDFWVLEKHYTSLTDILTEQGYSRDSIYPNTFTRGSTTLDIHTHILWADRIKARRWLVKKSQEEIFHRAAALRVDGQEVLCLSRTDLVLYLFLHALKHRLDRLIWLVDIRHLLAPCGAPEWQRLMDRAGDLGQERALASLIYLLQGLFGLTPPAQTRGGRNRSAPNALEKRLLRQRIEKDCIPFWGASPSITAQRGNEAYCLHSGNPFPEGGSAETDICGFAPEQAMETLLDEIPADPIRDENPLKGGP